MSTSNRSTTLPAFLSPEMASPVLSASLAHLRKCAPPLDGLSYKGQSGKIAVIGGSIEYTGAPYFAAMSAMRAGFELASVYCAAEAAPAIKAYAPDLVVYPGLDRIGTDCEMLERVDVVLIGPGLGRGEEGGKVVEKILKWAHEKKKPLVIDADGLWWLSKEEKVRNLLREGSSGWRIYLTPNVMELKRLQDVLRMRGAEEVATWFGGGVVVLEKGRSDKVHGAGVQGGVVIGNSGSLKRVGGLGDVLSGCVAVCAGWMSGIARTEVEVVAPAVCGSVIARAAAHKAFLQKGRSLVANDVLPYVGIVVEEILDEVYNKEYEVGSVPKRRLT